MIVLENNNGFSWNFLEVKEPKIVITTKDTEFLIQGG